MTTLLSAFDMHTARLLRCIRRHSARSACLGLIGMLLCVAVGCATSSSRLATKSEALLSQEDKIVAVALVDGTLIRFDEHGGTFVNGTAQAQPVIMGITVEGKSIQLPYDRISSVQLQHEESNAGLTILTIFGAAAAAFGLFIVVLALSYRH